MITQWTSVLKDQEYDTQYNVSDTYKVLQFLSQFTWVVIVKSQMVVSQFSNAHNLRFVNCDKNCEILYVLNITLLYIAHLIIHN